MRKRIHLDRDIFTAVILVSIMPIYFISSSIFYGFLIHGLPYVNHFPLLSRQFSLVLYDYSGHTRTDGERNFLSYKSSHDPVSSVPLIAVFCRTVYFQFLGFSTKFSLVLFLLLSVLISRILIYVSKSKGNIAHLTSSYLCVYDIS